VLNLPFQDIVGWQTNGVQETVLLQIEVDLRLRKGSISPEIQTHSSLSIPFEDGLQCLSPPLGTVHIAWPEDCSFTIPKLVKTEQGVVADTLKMTVVGRSFLLSIQFEDEAAKASKGQMSYTAFLARLVDEEVVNKTDRSVNARLAKARFPAIKTLESFDFPSSHHFPQPG